MDVIIEKDGLIGDVKIVESINGAELQEKELLRVIRLLPKMIPAQVDDGQPIRSSIKIPVKF